MQQSMELVATLSGPVIRSSLRSFISVVFGA